MTGIVRLVLASSLVQRSGVPMTQTYVPYSDDVETIDPDEQKTFEKIVEVMGKGGEITRERYKHYVRVSHAKAHGIVRGHLEVLPDLPDALRQGLFAQTRTYPVVARMAHVPGEILDDRKVSNPRGLAIKIFEVEGKKLPGHTGAATQDFVLDSGSPSFIAPGAKSFLASISAVEASTPMPEGVKSAVSTVSRAANAVLNAVGLNSANLDFFGHPKLHPLVETYYSQAAVRYGDYIAKLGVFPETAALRDMVEKTLDITDENGLRAAVVEWFATNSAEFTIKVQLCTDLKSMPVEDAHKIWPEDESPYLPVARLVLPRQDAFSQAARDIVDEDLLFCPAHSLAAHRPLGSVMRARMHAYEVLGMRRRVANNRATTEPMAVPSLEQ